MLNGKEGAGVFFDGESARPIPVLWRAEGAAALILMRGGAQLRRWRLDDLRRVRDGGAALRLSPGHESDEILTVADPGQARALARLCPDLDRPEHSAGALTRRIALRVGGAVAAGALLLFVIVPGLAGQLARLVPEEAEQQLGQTTARYLGEALGGSCETEAGRAALDALMARLTEARPARLPLRINVVDAEQANALTAPGGDILLFRGLIAQASGPDEVAGVLAHELGHVAARDPLRLTLRAAGTSGVISVVIGDVAGGLLIGALGEAVINARFSQEAEAAADAYAMETLRGARIAPAGFAAFFRRALETQGDGVALSQWIASHPATSGRLERIVAAPPPGETAPALSDAQWRDLQTICD